MTPQILPSGAKLTPFLLEKPAPTGILIVPGGGHGHLAVGHEGADIGAWLNARGYDAWMLEYTIAGAQNPAPIYPRPQNDALEAVAAIRAHNRVGKLGIWGFSAGGHLAAITATEPNIALDFAVLAYPVITLEEPFVNTGSRKNLLDENPDENLLKALSAHLRVSKSTPPTFLFHTGDDSAVAVENALFFYTALRQNGVPAELHIYENGRHGVGLAPDDPILSSWGARLEDWLQKR